MTSNANAVRFYPHPEPQKICVENSCSFCFENLKPYSDNHLKNKSIWNHRFILVHKNDKASLGYSCAMHGDCLKKWLHTKPICPTCKSPVEFNRDSTLSLREKAAITLLDGTQGVLLGIKVNAFLFFGSLVAAGHPKQIPSMAYQLATNSEVQTVALTMLTVSAVAIMTVAHMKRKGWFFEHHEWPGGYDYSSRRVLNRD